MSRGAAGRLPAPTRKTVVFVHGGWVTPACWDPFVSFFEALFGGGHSQQARPVPPRRVTR